jgi:tetratricopeptide (TPR) repeat protein
LKASIKERLLLIAAALVAFAGTLGGAFVFDDFGLLNDPVITSPSGWWESWKLLETRPLSWFSFWLNYQASGEHPFGWHALNLILHIAVILLLFETLKELIPPRAALIAAALFAVHPMLTESVAYVFARSILIAALLCLLAIRCWIRGQYWLAVFWFLLAMLAKEECVALPIFLLLLDLSRRRKIHWAPLSASFGVALLLGLRVLYAASVVRGSQAGPQAGITPLSYLGAEGTVILRYLRLVLLPTGFTIDAEVPRWPIAWLGVAAIVFVSAKYFKDLRPGFWFISGLVFLAPSSSILPAADLSADRRMYLPILALCAGLGLMLSKLDWKISAGIVAGLAAISFFYSGLWRNPEDLWLEAIYEAPNKVRPRIQLARSVDPARALEALTDAEQIAPESAMVYSEKGRVLLQLGRAPEALAAFGKALALDPNDPKALNNRGAALLALGQTRPAQADFERALKKDPCLFDALVNLKHLNASPEIPSHCAFTPKQKTQLD